VSSPWPPGDPRVVAPIPGVPRQFPAPPSITALPPVKRKARTKPWAKAFITVLLLSIVGALGAAALLVPPALRPAHAPALTFIDPDATGRAIRGLISQREKAVKDKDKTAFLAGVDTRDSEFVRRESTEYDNLIKLELDTFTLSPGRNSLESVINPSSRLLTVFPGGVKAVPVTIRYAVHGVDTQPVAVPWVPVFGQVNGVWKLGGELTTYQGDSDRLATSNTLPQGAGGQPWQGGSITVLHQDGLVILLSDSDTGIASEFKSIAGKSLATVISKVRTPWSKQILVTAVRDDAVFRSYFAFSVDGADKVAALAVPFYDDVPSWTTSTLHYTSSRVVFNPDEINEPARYLELLLTHEFTHVALGPETSGATPLWLVEGIADYVGYTTRVKDIDWSEVAGDMADFKFTELPDNRTFYDVGNPSYVASWLMCRYIAKTYGEPKLFELYNYFKDNDRINSREAWDAAVREELGTPLTSLEAGWLTFAKHPS